jgi:predicted secreted protein
VRIALSLSLSLSIYIYIYIYIHTQFIRPSGTSKSAAQQPRKTQQKGAYQYIENLSKFFCVLGAVAYLQVSPLGDSRDETWRGQGIRER